MDTSAVINVNVQSNDTPQAQYKTVVLKPNMVDDVNTLTQAMLDAHGQNTKFVIKYDYTLGENISVPSGCILDFDGGSLSGAYTLTGQNTKIECGKTKIFNTNVLFDGSFSTRSLDVRNFGAVGDNVTDDTNAFKAALRFVDTAHDEYSNTGIQPSRVMKGGTLYIPNGIYKITDTLTVKSQSYIIGESAEGVVLESTANVGIQLEGLTYNGSPYIHNVRLSNFFLKMHGGKVGIKNNTNASLGDCVFSNFTIQSVEVGMLLKGLWNCKFEKVCIESVNFGVILTDNSTLGCNNNIINNLIVASVNKCGLYLSSANGTYCTNLNIEGVGNTWAGDYAWCGDYSNISSTVDEVTYDVESPCAVYVAGTAYSNVFNCSWFEAIHATGTLAICYLIKNATSYPGVHRMSVTITDGYFNSDVDLPIKIATSAAVYLSRLNYWGNFVNGSIAIDYADQAYIDISFVIKGWITNIVSAAGKVTKWVNIHHILDDYQNIVNNYTFQNLQGYQLERNYYDNKDYPAYSVYYGKQIDAARKIIYNYASDIVDGYDYGNKKYVSVNNGGAYEYKTTDNGVISIPGTFTYGGKFIVKLTALDSVGAAAIASGYYISNNVNDNLQVSFVTPPAANCNFNYFVGIVA